MENLVDSPWQEKQSFENYEILIKIKARITYPLVYIFQYKNVSFNMSMIGQ